MTDISSSFSLSSIASLARKADPDRYVWALFLDSVARQRAFLALALNRELRKIPDLVSEPVLGQMRYQWWRESLSALAAGQVPPVHEILTPLFATLSAESGDKRSTLSPLQLLVDSCEAEFLAETPEACAEQRRAAAHHLAAFILPADSGCAPAMESYELMLAIARDVYPPDRIEEIVQQARGLARQVTTRPAKLLSALSCLYLEHLQHCQYDAAAIRQIMPHPARALVLFWKRLWI